MQLIIIIFTCQPQHYGSISYQPIHGIFQFITMHLSNFKLSELILCYFKVHVVQAVHIAPGPPFKKMLFPVQRPGDYNTAESELFFSFCYFFFFKSSKFQLFLPPPLKKNQKNGKKNIWRPPDWPQFRPPAVQETNFYLRVAPVPG